LFADGKHLTTYRKIHLYDNDVDWFLPGQEEPPVLEYHGYRFGVTLGYDWAFPELTRTLVLRGIQVLLHMTNLLLNYTPRAMVTRSIENRIFVAVASRIGEERGYKFIGGSQVTDPRGHVLLQTSKSEEGLFWVDIDPVVADNKAISKRSDLLKDRRPQFYGHLCDDP
jgi:predicted amidohydrolase